MCELIGHGQVISIRDGCDEGDGTTVHPRLRYCTAAPLDAGARDHVHDVVGGGNAVVVLGACADRATTAAQFEAYADLVGVGSYVIVTDTIVNGRPVWPSHGPGPGDAVKQILTRHGEFVADPEMEKYALSFNPGGIPPPSGVTEAVPSSHRTPRNAPCPADQRASRLAVDSGHVRSAWGSRSRSPRTTCAQPLVITISAKTSGA